MAAQQNGDAEGPGGHEADFARALKELAKGEQTAAAMENHLDNVERKIEELLKQAEEDEKKMKQGKANESTSSDTTTSTGDQEKST
ncbi:hypothetical protein K402DRAFT_329876 [Aulographum hederae CBS 113979]|uniref:Uncharacterized protein n=1 Tax=Aulographum hederae CBS 113979 TaxID=1176131 RepID=A0A6G1H3M9_9PEZI|nr:hypothetical protein K402DRAFT_329876 [Aulographum hederae CBS 113979]